MKKFKFYWKDGSSFESEGYDVAYAFSRAGYGGGAINALDWFEEI